MSDFTGYLRADISQLANLYTPPVRMRHIGKLSWGKLREEEIAEREREGGGGEEGCIVLRNTLTLDTYLISLAG